MDEDEEDESFREEPKGWDEVGADSVVADDLDWKARADLEFEKSKSQPGRQGVRYIVILHTNAMLLCVMTLIYQSVAIVNFFSQMVAEIGVIEVIEMYDFMCHRHLKVPFGPKINFIIGHNGSK